MSFREFVERYGVALAIVTIVSLVLVLLPGNAPPQTASQLSTAAGAFAPGEQASAGSSDSGVIPAAGSTTSGVVSVPGSAGAGAPGASVAPKIPGAAAGGVKLGVGPCRADQRMKGISKYMPPCLSWSGDNGGATARGVTRDKVKVVGFSSQSDPATQAILKSQKLADDPPVVERAFKALFHYSNTHFETYGREVTFEIYNASGPDDNDEAMKADAVKIANEVKAFAVIGGPKVLGQELAQRGVICICTVTLSSQFYKENPPYIFGTLPTNTEYAYHIAEFLSKRMNNKPAKWAGDELNPVQGFRTQNRKFGLLYIEGANGRVDPEGKRFRDAFVAELAKYNIKLAAEASYLYDPGRNQQDVTNIIATFRAAGVTTIIPIVDPLSPIFFTQEATRQQYYPEWFVTGTGLSDTSAAGRIYDKAQWSHAFGISPLWVTWADVSKSEGYREFHHGMPGMQPGDEGVLINIYRAPVQQVFTGVHMAGPKLTADTFSQGYFNFPPTGGTPAAPLRYVTREFPTEIKDFVEVWYDVNQQGKDERGDDGLGMMMKVDGGKRYKAGAWPRTDPKAFVKEGAIAVGDDPSLGGPLPHEQDGHTHNNRCISCA